MSDYLTVGLAVVLCAAAVKLFDDWLDQDRDQAANKANWVTVLGPGTTIYAALLLAIAAALHASVSLSLFFASYGIGMFHDFGRLLPSRLRGWQESVLVWGLGSVIFGWQIMLFSMLFIAGVQLFDDCLDLAADRRSGQRNLAGRFGLIECLLAGLLFMLSACWLSADLFPPVMAGTTVFYICLLVVSEGKPWN